MLYFRFSLLLGLGHSYQHTMVGSNSSWSFWNGSLPSSARWSSSQWLNRQIYQGESHISIAVNHSLVGLGFVNAKKLVFHCV